MDYLLSSFILTLGVSLPLVFHCVFSKRQTNLQERAYLLVRGMHYINEWRQPRLRKTAPRVPKPCDDLLLKLQRLRAERSAAKCDVQSLLYAIGNARSWQSRFKKRRLMVRVMLTHTMMTQQHGAIMRNRNEAYTVKCTANNEQLWIAAYEDPVQGYEHRKLETEQLKWKCAKQKWNGLIMHLYCEYPLLPLFQHKAQVEYYYHSILNVSSRSRKNSRPFFTLCTANC